MRLTKYVLNLEELKMMVVRAPLPEMDEMTKRDIDRMLADLEGIGMSDKIASLEVYVVDLSQDRPYLGNLSEAESVNPDGYFVRQQNGTVYVRNNRSIVLRITTGEWGRRLGRNLRTCRQRHPRRSLQTY